VKIRNIVKQLNHPNATALTIVEYPFRKVNHENIIGQIVIPIHNNKLTFMIFDALPLIGIPQYIQNLAVSDMLLPHSLHEIIDIALFQTNFFNDITRAPRQISLIIICLQVRHNSRAP